MKKQVEETNVDAVIAAATAVDLNSLVRVLDAYVLVKQVMKKKSGKILMDAMSDNKDKFDFSFEIIQKGPKCEREFNLGEHPIFETHVQFAGVKVIEKTDAGMISLLVVHENSIVGVDLDPESKQT